MNKLTIERDHENDREYIPLAGGYEWQTKGKGSTVRILLPDGKRHPLSWNPDWIEQALSDCMRAQNTALAQHKQAIRELVEAAQDLREGMARLIDGKACREYDHKIVRFEAAVANAKVLMDLS